MSLHFSPKKTLSITLKVTIVSLVLIIVALIASDRIVENFAEGKLYNSIKKIPENKVGLLLGTNKYLSNGSYNLFYKYRIEAAAELYKAGKIKYIIVSGDNSRNNYDEATQMKNDLIKKGVPGNRIYCDYAGFRTLDSVVRSKEIFGQTKITIISQQFHNERAIYIANQNDIEAIGYNAKNVKGYGGFMVKLRERFARVKMMYDLLIGVAPKFLGEKIKIR